MVCDWFTLLILANLHMVLLQMNHPMYMGQPKIRYILHNFNLLYAFMHNYQVRLYAEYLCSAFIYFICFVYVSTKDSGEIAQMFRLV